MKKFPKQIYVTRDNSGTVDEFLAINVFLEQCAEMGEKKPVAIYRLEQVISVRGKAMIEK